MWGQSKWASLYSPRTSVSLGRPWSCHQFTGCPLVGTNHCILEAPHKACTCLISHRHRTFKICHDVRLVVADTVCVSQSQGLHLPFNHWHCLTKKPLLTQQAWLLGQLNSQAKTLWGNSHAFVWVNMEGSGFAHLPLVYPLMESHLTPQKVPFVCSGPKLHYYYYLH